MANTYTQIHIQCVFAVKFRQALIQPTWKETLNKYITGIVQKNGHKMIAIGGMPDHIHLLFGFRPTQSLSDLMSMVKGDSSLWINQRQFLESQFRWQNGYGGFSYSRSQVPMVANYIENQVEHHRQKNFLLEYQELLEEFDLDFDNQYIFKEPE